MIIYEGPIPGLDANGNEVACNRQVSMTRTDIIKVQRWVFREALKKRGQEHLMSHGKKYTLLTIPEDHLLDEFMLLHWTHENNDETTKPIV